LKLLHISTPYVETEMCLLVQEASDYRKPEDLSSASVGVGPLPVNETHLRAVLPQAHPVVHADEASSVEAVCDGNVDAALIESHTAVSTLLSGGSCAGRPLRWIAIPRSRVRLGIGSSFQASAAADGLRVGISWLAAQDRLAPVAAQWGFLSGSRLDQMISVLNAQRRERWLIGGIAFSVLLMLIAVWQTMSYRRELRHAQRAEQARGEIEQRLKLLTDGLKDMVLAFDMERNPIYANPAVELLTGFKAGELRNGGIVNWVHPEDKQRVAALWELLFEGVSFQDQEYRLVAKSGAVKWISATWGPLADLSGRHIGVQGCERDISERKSSERVLRESEERYRSLFERSLDCVFLMDFDGQLLDMNQAALDLLGYQRYEIPTLSMELLLVADHLQRARQGLEAVRANGRQLNRSEYQLIRKDKEQVFVEVQTSLICREGKPLAVQGIGRDITERKRTEAERERLWAQLTQAQKMESVGRLAGGVAHDFNNLLTVINGFSGLVHDKLAEDDPIRSQVAEIRKAGERARGLTSQLLAFSRKQVLKACKFDLNWLLKELRPLLTRLLGEDVELVLECGPATGAVFADPHQIEQVIMNLAVNARDAMPAGGRLAIKTSHTELGEDFTRVHREIRPGHFVALTVSDSGTGMDPETMQHIFEPFFTTKGNGQGTGLGLSMVDGIVVQSGGAIEVFSAPGAGATFQVYLPAVMERTLTAPSDPMARVCGGSETLLVVEDQAEVRKFAAEALKGYGYHVVQAADAGTALALEAGRPDGFDLVLADLVMPGKSGKELAARLRKIQPDIGVLLMSGYDQDTAGQQAIRELGAEFIQKPFTAEELATKVRSVLDAVARNDSQTPERYRPGREQTGAA